jgi:proline iminopeptidase
VSPTLKAVSGILWVPLLTSCAAAAGYSPALPPAATASGGVVHVAPPTGEREADRASILAALEQVRPGGTIRFAPGTYLVGEAIQVPTPRITLLGHPAGTTLRGCETAELDEVEREADRESDLSALFAILLRCGMLELTGGHVTVRDFTLENTRMGLLLGCCHADLAYRPSEGGYRIENNTFRNSGNAIRALLSSAEPTVIRGNRFINVFHALSAGASHLHMVGNDISVPEPQRVPGRGHPGFGIGIWPIPGDFVDRSVSDGEDCEHNIIAGNRIEGHETGIVLFGEPGLACRQNVIRDNTIVVRRVRFDAARWPADAVGITDAADSTIVGVPLTLHNPSGDGRIEDNLIEGNRIAGAEGIGIEVLRASGNRIINNTITDIRRRHPFPGNTLGGEPERWAVANGAGIWISPGSEGNSLEGNVFEGIAGASVVREGELEAADGVRLYYRVEGEGRDTVVALHGGPSLGHGYLAPDLVPLTRGRAVVHYDQRGIGRSTPLTDAERLSIERHVEDLEALRTHLGLERLALLGHSWGGMLAARYAAAHPQRVARILLLEPMAPARDPFMAIAGARAREIVRARLDETERARFDSLAAAADVDDAGAHCQALFSLLTPIYFEDPTATTRSRADFCVGSPETLRIRGEVDAAIFGSLGAWDVRPTVGNVTSPVLVLHGAAGAIPREAMEAWADAFPNARLITIDRAGHYLHVDRPEAFFRAAEVFFNGGWPEAEAPGSGTVSAGETALDERVDVDGDEVETLVYVPPRRMPAAYRQPLRYERIR